MSICFCTRCGLPVAYHKPKESIPVPDKSTVEARIRRWHSDTYDKYVLTHDDLTWLNDGGMLVMDEGHAVPIFIMGETPEEPAINPDQGLV